ncbi:unnamed protein product [Orchesella dallaii]|uniref:G-protein coupled receptors family 1 profile domain-containing protein n=1 Tax=Orchesella dallaii TaxID=48710 RepID=A0ABP1QCI3_9HEXA
MTHQQSVVTLNILTCFHIDLPLTGNRDCSLLNSTICVECDVITRFFTGELLTETSGSSHRISLGIWLITVIVGLFGITNNIVIALVVNRRRTKRKKFDFLITFLAVFDSFTCIGSIYTTTASVLFFYGYITLDALSSWYSVKVTSIAVLFSRSLSYFMTVIINTYCYAGVAHPLRTKQWFSWKTVRMLPLLALVVAVFINIPRLGCEELSENVYNEKGFDIPSLRGFKYIAVQRNKCWKFWFETMFRIHDYIDYLLPLPILLLLNFLSYLKMRELKRSRMELSSSQLKRLKPVKMFLPVVFFLFFCNIGPFIMFVTVVVTGVVYRELSLMLALWNALNCSANFVIYYWRSNEFRKDTNALFLHCFGRQ